MRRLTDNVCKAAEALQPRKGIVHGRSPHGDPSISGDFAIWLAVTQIAVSADNAEVELVSHRLDEICDATNRPASLEDGEVVAVEYKDWGAAICHFLSHLDVQKN